MKPAGALCMKILALEFSTNQRSVAVIAINESSGHLVVSEVLETGASGRNSVAMIEKALLDANLDRDQIECLAVGLGPGSYTGIRGAIALAQGWQLARGVKLLGISSALCIAAQAQAQGSRGTINVVIDAQREEFYLATYNLGPDSIVELAPLQITSLGELREREQAGEILTGPEATRWFSTARNVFPGAATLARLASGKTGFVAGEKLEPIYLREASFVKAPSARKFFK